MLKWQLVYLITHRKRTEDLLLIVYEQTTLVGVKNGGKTKTL